MGVMAQFFLNWVVWLLADILYAAAGLVFGVLIIWLIWDIIWLWRLYKEKKVRVG